MVALSAAMLLAGCGHAANDAQASASAMPSAVSTAAASETADALVGGYVINSALTASALPNDAQKAFDKALEAIEGAEYDPIVLLGRQAVSGTNYAILCKVTPVVPNANSTSELAVVTVYEDLNGNAYILSAEEFDLAAVTGVDQAYSADPEMAGGFQTSTEFTAQTEDDAAAKVFDAAEAEAEKNGAHYTFVAELGEQVVGGTNYAFLALRDGDDQCWAVITAYENIDGAVSLGSVYEFDAGTFTSYGEVEEGTAGADTEVTPEASASAVTK